MVSDMQIQMRGKCVYKNLTHSMSDVHSKCSCEMAFRNAIILRRDKENYMRVLAKDVYWHFNINAL